MLEQEDNTFSFSPLDIHKSVSSKKKVDEEEQNLTLGLSTSEGETSNKVFSFKERKGFGFELGLNREGLKNKEFNVSD